MAMRVYVSCMASHLRLDLSSDPTVDGSRLLSLLDDLVRSLAVERTPVAAPLPLAAEWLPVTRHRIRARLERPTSWHEQLEELFILPPGGVVYCAVDETDDQRASPLPGLRCGPTPEVRWARQPVLSVVRARIRDHAPVPAVMAGSLRAA